MSAYVIAEFTVKGPDVARGKYGPDAAPRRPSKSTLDWSLFRATLPRVRAHGAGSLVPLSTGASAESDEGRSSRKPALVWPTSIR